MCEPFIVRYNLERRVWYKMVHRPGIDLCPEPALLSLRELEQPVSSRIVPHRTCIIASELLDPLSKLLSLGATSLRPLKCRFIPRFSLQ